MKHVLNPDRLYIGDNGRLFCGKPQCAGATASATGHDLSGQKVDVLSAASIRAMQQDLDSYERGLKVACEGCGFPKNGPRYFWSLVVEAEQDAAR